jgi:hypothetical protein
VVRSSSELFGDFRQSGYDREKDLEAFRDDTKTKTISLSLG